MDDGKFVPVEVQSIHRNKAPYRAVRASQSASLGLDFAPIGLRSGMVLLSSEEKPMGCLFFQVIKLWYLTVHRSIEIKTNFNAIFPVDINFE